MTSGILWNYHKDEIDDDAHENNATNNRINNNQAVTK